MLRADGRAASQATVEVAQPRSGDRPLGTADARPGCVTAAACSAGAPGIPGASALVNRWGAFVVPERAVHPGLRSVVTAVLPPLDKAQWTGPETSAALEDGPDVPRPQEVPDLFSWEPRLFFASGGGDLRIRWPALDVGLQTRAVEYTVEAVLAGTGMPVVEVAAPQ